VYVGQQNVFQLQESIKESVSQSVSQSVYFTTQNTAAS